MHRPIRYRAPATRNSHRLFRFGEGAGSSGAGGFCRNGGGFRGRGKTLETRPTILDTRPPGPALPIRWLLPPIRYQLLGSPSSS
jgi:hypothetical protein